MSLDPSHASLDAIFWALKNHIEPAAKGASTMFLRARACPDLALISNLSCVQSFKPWADELSSAGFAHQPELPDDAARAPGSAQFSRILLLPCRQRAETRALLAHAALRLADGGQLVAAQLNTEGARSLQSDCEALLGEIHHESKFKSRVMWGNAARLDRALAAQWIEADQPTPVVEGEFLSRPGLFAWDRIDPGSALLAQHLPTDFRGTGADLGCGFGVLSKRLLERNPSITGLDCFEAEHRALQLAEHNLHVFSAKTLLKFHWHDVSRGLLRDDYDFIISNPPFHTGRMDEPSLGLSFLTAAARGLKPGGRFVLVANAHLPYETLLSQYFQKVTRIAQAQGYKVLEAGT